MLKIFHVEAQHHGVRLDQFINSQCHVSRQRAQQLLRDGYVQGLGSLKAATKVKYGHEYRVKIPELEPLKLCPENIPLDVLYEDEDLLIVNKSPDMVVHPSHGHDTGTLVHALLHHCTSLPGINGVERPGIVHRIDKGTSGSLVVAKSEAAHHGLSALFASHDIQREYIAWCQGLPCWREKRIETYLSRHRYHRKKMAVSLQGKYAVTDAVVEQNYHNFCRMRLKLQTGRTHQIRVHLSHEKCPILGDTVYARRHSFKKDVSSEVRNAIKNLQRQALHAEVLGFIHPISKEEIHVIAPLPSDLIRLSSALENVE